jgi:hypothetical protein
MSKVEELKAKYPKITAAVFNRFVEGDKTKTKKYLPFMLKTWVNKTSEITNSIHLIQLVNMFDELLPYIENKDIYHKDYENITYFLEVLNKAMVDKEEKTFNREEHIEVIEENDDYILLRPKTHKGSLKYGANTKWCTASKTNQSTFTSYVRTGYLVYLISKKDMSPNFSKIAFYLRKDDDSFTGTIECYNVLDRQISAETIIKSEEWSPDVIFKIMTKIRLNGYRYQKIIKSKDVIESAIRGLSYINFEDLTESITLLEKVNDIDYISKTKNKINDFVSKLEKINI